MIRRTDDLLQRHTELVYHSNNCSVDDNANTEPVKYCHHFVDNNKMYSSCDNSVDSGIGSKEGNIYQSEIDMTNENSTLTTGTYTEATVRCTKTAPYASETANIFRCYKKVTKQNNIRIVFSISLVVNIVLIVTVAVLGTILGANMGEDEYKCPLHQLQKSFEQESLCIPCDYLGSRVKAEETMFDIIFSCGHTFCCVKNAPLQKFFLVMLQNEHASEGTAAEHLTSDESKLLARWRSRSTAAHLYANVTSLPEKLTWQTNLGYGSAFTQGITLTPESRLMVPTAGLYFVYSAVTFNCQTESTPLIHLINRQHKGRPNAGVQQLLLSKTSECGAGGFYTSYISGVLKLTSNDELSVTLTDLSLSRVYRTPLANYFGVYLL